MKMTQKQIREFIREGVAIDITTKSHEEIQEIRKAEGYFKELATAKGTYRS